MSDVIDNRVVQMQFDNKDFDKNIQKSQKSLEDFKKSLNFDDASSQMRAFAQSTNVLSTMADNIQKLTNNFAGIGDIGTEVAKKIHSAWTGALRSVEQFTKSLTTVQMKKGFEDKYQGLLKSVQTIMNAVEGVTESQVYGVMDTLMHYSDETSYDFADMAKNIGKFTTAGVGLEDAEMEMEGIANWAALAGQGVGEAQRAMYNISQAMSAGYMKLMDYKSIQNASMDIRAFRKEAINAAVAVGTLVKKGDKFYTKKGNKQVTIDNFTETLQYKWFDKATMEKVFKAFGDQSTELGRRAYAAAQRCITFSDALNAVKDMLSTGWMQTYQNIFGKMTDAMNLFSGLCIKVSDALARFAEIRNGILEHWNSGGGRDSLWAMLVGEIETPDGDVLYKGAFGLLDILTSVGDLIEGALYDFVGNFVAPFNLDEYNSNPEELYAKIGALLISLTNKAKKFVQGIKDFFTEIPPGATESRFDQLRKVIEAIYGILLLGIQVIAGISRFVGELMTQLIPARTAILYLIGYISELITGKAVDITKNNVIGNWFHQLAESLRPFTNVINHVIGFVVNVIGKLFEMANNVGLIQAIGDAFTWLTGVLSTAFQYLYGHSIANIFDAITTALNGLPPITNLKDFGKAIKDFVKNTKLFKAVWPTLSKYFSADKITTLWNSVTYFFENIKTEFPKVLESAKAKLKGAISSIGGLFETIVGWILGGVSSSAKAEDASDEISEAIVEAIVPEDGRKVAEEVNNKVGGVFDNVKNFFDTLVHTTLPAIGEKIKTITGVFAGFNWEKMFGGVMDFMKVYASIKWAGSIGKIGKGIGNFGKGMGKFGKGIGKGLAEIGKGYGKQGLSGLFKNFVNLENSFNTKGSNNVQSTLGGFGTQLLMIAGAVWVVVDALNRLKGVKLEDIKQPILELSGILVSLIGAAILAKYFAGNGIAFVSIAGSLVVMILAIKMLGKIEWDSLRDSMFKLSIIAGFLVAVAQKANGIQIKGMVGLAVSLGIMVGVIRELGHMDAGVAWSGILRLIPILGALAGVMWIVGKSNFNGMKGVIGLAVAVALLVIPIKILGKMDIGSAAQGILAVASILLVLGWFLDYTKDVDQASKIAGLVGTIAALSLVAIMLGNMPFGKALVGVGSIVAMIMSISYLIKQTSKLNDKQLDSVSKVFKSISLVIIIAAAAIGILSKLNVSWALAGAFFGGMALMVAAVGKALPALSELSLPKALKGIAILGVAVAALSAVIALVAPMIMESFGEGIALFFKKLSTVGSDVKSFVSAFSGIGKDSIQDVKDKIVTLFETIKILGDFTQYRNAINSFRIQLNNLRAGISGFFNNDSQIPDPKSSNVCNTLLELKTILPDIASINLGDVPNKITLLGAGISLFTQLTSEVPAPDQNNALKFLERLFQQAENIRKIATLPLTSLSGKMSTLGGAISIYAGAAQNLKGVENPSDPETIAAGISMLEAICQSITGEDGNGGLHIPDNMPSEGRLGVFGAELAALGGALTSFGKACTGMNAYSVEKVTSSLTTLGTLNHDLTEDKLAVAEVFDKAGVDSSVLGEFATCIEALGGALNSFATMTKDGDYSIGLKALDALVEIDQKLTQDIIDVFTVLPDNQITESTLSTFAGDIEALGNSLSTFANTVNFVDENGKIDDAKVNSFTNAIDNLSKLADMSVKMPKVGGAVQFLEGHVKGLDEFGHEIERLGEGLSKFSTQINGLPVPEAKNSKGKNAKSTGFQYSEKVENALSVLEQLIKIEGTIPEHQKIEGLVQRIQGHVKGLDDIGRELGELGIGLVAFSNEINGVPETGEEGSETSAGFQYTQKVKDALAVLNQLLTIQGRLPKEKVDGLIDLVEGHAQTLKSLSGDIGTLGSALREFSIKLNGADGLGSFDAEMVTAALGAVNQLVQMASTLSRGSIETGQTFEIGWYVNTLAGIFDNLAGDSFNIATNAAAFAANVSSAFSSTEGIDMAALSGFSALASGLANFATLSTSGTGFESSGEVITAKIADGINTSQENVLSAVSTLIEAINAAFTAGINTSPTISPVLDTTQLESDITAFNTRGISVSLPSSLDVTVTNPVDLAPVTTAIAALQTQVSELGTAISNIKIVLNSGPLVGGIAGDMDNLLGRRGTFAARRNAVPNRP